MTANKMPEMPEADGFVLITGHGISYQPVCPECVMADAWKPRYTADQMRAMYLAGIEAARACVPSSLTETLHSGSFQAGFETACIEMDHRLTNLTALEQESAP